MNFLPASIAGIGPDGVALGLPATASASGRTTATAIWVIGSIVDFLPAPGDPGAVIEKLAAPETRIDPLTLTEGGY